jgi:DNA-binding NarL/FixJ family response regulator
MVLRVVFADDNYLVREGVSALLAEADDIELVGTAADPNSLVKLVAELSPDAVLTDIRMPPTHTNEGIVAAKRIRAEFPSTGVVVLSQYVEEDYAFELLADGVAGLGYLLKERVSDLEELVRALHEVARGGSSLDPRVVEGLLADGVAGLGYLLKERVSDLEELVRALHEVARGGSSLDPRVVEGLLARKSAEDRSPLLGLTDREREVLQEMASGRNNATIAKTLFMSDRAVEKHIGSVFQKLGLVDEREVNRRVMAVLAYLEAVGPAR